jgi:mxaD protein
MDVKLQATISAEAGKVWETVGDFNALPKFVAAAIKSEMRGEGLGALRTLTLPDGQQIVEKLESYDAQAKTLEYSILSGPLPVQNYRSAMKITATGRDECTLEWSSSFTPRGVSEDKAREAIEAIYVMGFDGLKKLYGA